MSEAIPHDETVLHDEAGPHDETVLHDFWRSSAAYRVRIALNLKGIAYRAATIDLPSGQQSREEYHSLNPQGLIPTLEIDGHVLTQSLAIIDYLDATRPEPPMVSSDPLRRSHTLARALVIAADIHPINNLRVLNTLRNTFSLDGERVDMWVRHWIADGFEALEQGAPETGLFGGDSPDLADVCLVPQMYNARRFELPLGAFPRLARIDAELRSLDAFARAAPEAVKPAKA